MKAIELSVNNSAAVKKFISKYEYSCVELASLIRKNDKNTIILSYSGKVDSPEDIFGVINVNSTIVHCLPFTDDAKAKSPDTIQLITQLFSDNKFRCISGELKSTEYLLNVLGIESDISQKNLYRLMTLSKQPQIPPEELSNGDEIKRCTENDRELLTGLQKKYLQEEVAPRGKKVSDLEASLHLKQILKTQLVLCIFSDDEPVAKANTNAIGINWVQLGGIYTHPLYRRNHYAWILVESICRRVMKSQKNVSLFVKDINVPAIELYKKIGFVEKEKFEISYFQV